MKLEDGRAELLLLEAQLLPIWEQDWEQQWSQKLYGLRKGEVIHSMWQMLTLQHTPLKGWGCKARGPSASKVPEKGLQQDFVAVPCCGTPTAPQAQRGLTSLGE